MIVRPSMTRRRPEVKTIRDPVHGDISVLGMDLPLLDSPELQRLRGVRQLGSAYHVYPGAQHTRFEHSLGTYHVAGKLVEAIRDNHGRDPRGCRDVSPREEAIVRAVALLHDLTHIPHGHAMEDQDGLFPRHDRPELLRRHVSSGTVGKALRARRILEPVAAHLTEGSALRSPTPFLSSISNGAVGADILDYLRRDIAFTGLRLDYDDRLLEYVKIEPRSGVVYIDLVKHDMDREDVLTEILNLLRCRYVCSERIYYHHAKIASGALVSRAVEIAVMGGLARREIETTTDASLLAYLRGRSFRSHPLGVERARAIIDRLLTRFEERRLPKRCFVIGRPGNESRQDALVSAFVDRQEERMRVEAEIAQALGVRDPADVIVYCPRKSMQLKEAQVPVRRAKRPIRPLTAYEADFPALHQLVDSYRNLWKLYVFVPDQPAQDLQWAGKRAERILRRRFPGIRNQFHP
ncbi:MAG TPA: HD domain-containing protein [Dongiaceae bacterium]|nr:HD domain-containing protein [Dongiaceae bacterium]